MSEPKTTWEKADILLKFVGALLPAVVITLFGFMGRSYLVERETREANSRLYTELTSNREQADSSLRSGMFDTVISTFLSSQAAEPSDHDTVLAIELLAQNFHDVIDLAPLFQQVNDRVSQLPLQRQLQACLQESHSSLFGIDPTTEGESNDCLRGVDIASCLDQSGDILDCTADLIEQELAPEELASLRLKEQERRSLRGRLESVATDVVRSQIASLSEGTASVKQMFYYDRNGDLKANSPASLEVWLPLQELHVESVVGSDRLEREAVIRGSTDGNASAKWTATVSRISSAGDYDYLALSVEDGNKIDAGDKIYISDSHVATVVKTFDPNTAIPTRFFRVEPWDIRPDDREAEVRLTVSSPRSKGGATEFDQNFWVGFYDFPMIDNTRLTDGHRGAVVLTRMSRSHAELALVYFPASRASLKERLYYDEVIEDLQNQRSSGAGQ